MKSKISKILGVVLSLTLLSSLAMIAVPVSAATGPGTNAWQEVLLPETMPGIQVRILELAPNGDLYAGVVHDSGGSETMALWKSEDGGYNWEETPLDNDYLDGAFIYSIAVSPDSQTVYVGTDDGYGSYLYARIWKIEDAGEGVPVPLQTIYGIDEGESLEYADMVYDLEVWSDGQYNYVLAACDIDVLILRDALIETWVDLDLTGTYEDGSPSFDVAPRASFAPDFETSFLIWAIVILDNTGSGDTEFVITSCNVNSPGAWGALVKPAEFIDYTLMEDDCDIYVDFAFAEGFDSFTNPIMYAALCEDDGSPTSDIDGNLFLVEFAQAASTQDTEFMPLLDNPGNGMCSVEVADSFIAAGDRWDNRIVISTDNGGTFVEATKPPTGIAHTQLILGPGFDAEDGIAYATAWEEYPGYESAFSISEDGCDTFNQVGGLIDTTIDVIRDMTFSPDFPGGSYMLLHTYSSDYDHMHVWRTTNGDAAAPVWERVMCGEDDTSWNSGNTWISEAGEGSLIEWSQDGSTVMLFEEQEEEIWKSTDNAQTFTFWRDMPSEVDITDWVVLDGVTFYAATDSGFYRKTAYGPSMWVDTLGSLNSIALQPGFDVDDDDSDTIVVGTNAWWNTTPDPDVYQGEIIASTDGGATWGDPVVVDTDPVNDFVDVFVAFDQMDPTVVYYATGSSVVGSASISGNVVTDNGPFEDSMEATAEAESFSGLWVSPGTLDEGGNVLYAMGSDEEATNEVRTVEAWGRINLDLFSMMAAGQALVVDEGTIDTATETGLTVEDFLLVPTSGTFQDNEPLTIDSGFVTVIAPTIVAGTIVVSGDTSGAEGTVDLVYTADDGISGLTVGDTYAVTENAAMDVDDDDWSPWAMVMGSDVTEVAAEDFSDGDTPDVTAHTVVVDSTFPTIASGDVAIQNPVVGKGTFEVTWDAIFGFDNGDLGESLDDFNDYNIEIDVVMDYELVADAEANLFRILIGEVDNEWETAPKDGAVGLWGTKGSNILWTVVNSNTLWALKDTMATMVRGVTVTDIGETSAKVNWAALTGAKQYQVKYDSTSKFVSGSPLPTNTTISPLTDDTDYTVKVRVPAGQPFQSRWSAAVDFTTLEAIAMPDNQVPPNGMQGAPIRPSFVWYGPANAISWEFELGTAPDFTGATKITTTVSRLTWATDLLYDQNYYWRVRGVSVTGTYSEWCVSNFHTMLEPIPPVTVEPPPTPTINLPQPTVTVDVPPITLPDITVVPPPITVELPDVTETTVQPVIELPEEETPVYIWAIVAIGAVLTIAVIILIIRTRRVV